MQGVRVELEKRPFANLSATYNLNVLAIWQIVSKDDKLVLFNSLLLRLALIQGAAQSNFEVALIRTLFGDLGHLMEQNSSLSPNY